MTAGGPAPPGAAEQGKKAFLGRMTPGKPARVEKLDTLQKGQQPRTALPNASVSPFGNPFDKILQQIAHSSLRSSHTICRKISLLVFPSSAHVRRRKRILTFSTV